MTASDGAQRLARQHSTRTSAPSRRSEPLPVRIWSPASRADPNPLVLREGSCVLGAGVEADLIIHSETVSRRHAELTLVPEGVCVTDLGSKNGCFFLGQRFERMVLHPGSRFLVGSNEIRVELDTDALSTDVQSVGDRYGELISVAPSMRELFATLQRLEGSKVNVLITGESGTGKDLIAGAIHDHSPVREGPLVTVNCGALERNLVRSELFGHQRGAFTGATRDHVGAFESAHGGSLFLDEIGELPLDVQPVLLRAIETRRITPIGARSERPVDVRLLAATHRDLEAQVAQGSFRQDLFYRIRVVRLDVPPLRRRPEDVPVLARALARRQGATLPEDFVRALCEHTWPGNVRELAHAIEAYVAVGHLPVAANARPEPEAPSRGKLLEALDEFVDPESGYSNQKEEVVRLMTQAYLEALLQRTEGNQSEAARISGLDRGYLGRLVSKLGLSRAPRRS